MSRKIEGEAMLDDIIKPKTRRNKVRLNKGVVRELTNRPTTVKIIRELYENNEEPLYVKELTEKVGKTSVPYLLKKLWRIGLIEPMVTGEISKVTKYYRIVDRNVAERIIRHYFYRVSFKLAHLVPNLPSGIDERELKVMPGFVDLCQKFGLSLNEGVDALCSNKRAIAVMESPEGSRILGSKWNLGFGPEIVLEVEE